MAQGESIPLIHVGSDPASEAVDWHVLITSGEANPAERAAFDRWIAHEDNARNYAEIDAIWDLMGEALQVQDKIIPLHVSRQSARRRFFKRPTKQVWALAASLVVAILAGVQYQRVWQYDHVTEGSKRETAVLADGSQVHLNTGTAFSVKFEGGVRKINLARGEAFFDVTHDPKHPFVVDAGNGSVQVLGTAFSVKRNGDGAQIIVQRGKVRVRAGKDVADITPDQQISYANGKETPVQQVNSELALAWTKGRLVFENRPLGEVIDALDRYYPGVVMLNNDQASKRRVNAVIDLGRIDDWLDALDRSQGVKARRLPGLTILG